MSKKHDLSHHPHDRFFKSALLRPEVLRGFLERIVPKEFGRLIDFSRLRICDSETEGISYGRSHLDLIVESWTEKEKIRVQVLVEHKSYRDPGALMQLLSYQTALWREDCRRKRRPTPILPVIFYHGKEPWGMAESFQEVHGFPAEFRERGVNFSPGVFDTSVVGDGEILDGIRQLRVAVLLMAFKYARMTKEKMVAGFREAIERMGGEGALHVGMDIDFLVDVIEYYAGIHRIEDQGMLGGELEQVFGRGRMMTVVDKIRQEGRREGLQEGLQEGRQEGLQEGRQEGLQEGRQEGLQEGRREMVKALLKKRHSAGEIASMLDLDYDWVRSVEKEGRS